MTRRSSRPSATSTTRQSGESCSSAPKRGGWPSSRDLATSRCSDSSNSRRWTQPSPHSNQLRKQDDAMGSPKGEPFSLGRAGIRRSTREPERDSTWDGSASSAATTDGFSSARHTGRDSAPVLFDRQNCAWAPTKISTTSEESRGQSFASTFTFQTTPGVLIPIHGESL